MFEPVDHNVRDATEHTLRPSEVTGDPPGSPTPLGGRYRVLHRHAGGGLGEVYLAWDEELHRDVALKELQARFADDENLRARFVLEAEITGGLEHPNIVPVYGFGRDEHGRPFYAMRFIRGESLLEAIKRLHDDDAGRKPPGERILMLRRLLGFFIDVCNAAAYAHSRGVIHRDLKPENVMLGPYGETLLVDWGLARLVQRETSATQESATGDDSPQPCLTLHPVAAGSPAPTQVGSVVGTLAYMSPEQAAGLVDQLGPACDIYGLGGILFAILTNRAPFQGSSIDKIRQQIIVGKYPLPRTIDPQISPALEAVCVKAMALDPVRRYATARELAEDVEAWLADEPVRAWREPWRVRAGRWLRRHRTIVGGAMAAVLATVVSLAVGIVLLTAANEREREARSLAERQEQQARANFQLAREAVDEFFTRVSDDPRLKAQNLERLRRDLLETARGFYEKFINDHPGEPDLQGAWGWAHVRLAAITSEIGSKQQATELLETALATFTTLAAAHPEVTDYQIGVLRARVELSQLYTAISQPEKAAAVLAPAQSMAEERLARDPKSPMIRFALAAVHGNTAQLHVQRKQADQAIKSYQSAVAVLEPLVAECPDAADYRSQLAKNQASLGLLCRTAGRQDEARKLLVSAADLNQRLVDQHPNTSAYLMDLASACDNLAILFGDMAGATAQIETAYQKALAVRQTLQREHPDVTQHQADVAHSHFNLAMLYLRSGAFSKADASLKAARQVYQRLTDEHADVPSYRDDMASIMNNQGLLFRSTNRLDEAEAAFRSAIEIRRKLTDKYPKNTAYQRNLVTSYVNLGDTLRMRHRLGEAETAYHGALDVCKELAVRSDNQLDQALDLASMEVKLGHLAIEEGNVEAARDHCEKSLAVFEGRSKPDRERPGVKMTLRDAYWGQAEAISLLGQHEGAAKAWERAFALDSDPNHLLLRLGRAESLARAGDHARATAEAKDLSPQFANVAEGLFRLAKAWAAASSAAEKDSRLPEPERARLAGEYAAAAVTTLGQCRDAGFFKDPFHAAKLKEDPFPGPLRAQEAYSKLLDGLDGK